MGEKWCEQVLFRTVKNIHTTDTLKTIVQNEVTCQKRYGVWETVTFTISIGALKKLTSLGWYDVQTKIKC